MSAEENMALARRFMEARVNGDLDALDEMLPPNFVSHTKLLPEGLPVFLYHSRDDEWVPYAHLALYAEKLPQATIHEFDGRGHQFDGDLSEVARDIKEL